MQPIGRMCPPSTRELVWAVVVEEQVVCHLAANTLCDANPPEMDMPNLQLVDKRSPPRRAEITDAEGAAMARAVVNLFARWQLGDREAATLLGGLSPRTWARWKRGEIGRLDRDRKARLSNLMGIHKALRLIFNEKARSFDWIRRPNAAFGGRSALDVMLDGELTDLMRVRRYLDAERGLW